MVSDYFLYRCYLILSVLSTVLCKVYNLGDKQVNVPDVASIDDYIACRGKNDVYCHARIKLYPSDIFSKEWKELINNITGVLFDRTEIFRTVCIPKDFSKKEFDRKEYIKNLVQEKELDTKYLEANVYHIRCEEEDIKFDYYDYVLMYIALIYISIILTATFLQYFLPNDKERSWRYLHYFSLIYNWRKLTSSKSSKNIAKNESLKSMQGVRAILSELILIGHLLAVTVVGYPDGLIIDLFDNKWFFKICAAFYMETVQVFFLFSSWLLSYKLLTEFQDPEKCNIGNIIRKIFHRIIRSFPCLVVAVAIASSNFSLLTIFPTPLSDIGYYTLKKCRTNWWATLLYFNNEVAITCYPIAWYLSADMQIYIISSLLIYFFTKYKLNKNYFALLAILATGVHASKLSKYNTGPVFVIKKNYRFEDLFDEKEYHFHTSTVSSLATAFLGILFRYFYHKISQEQTLIHKKYKNKFWFLITIFLFTCYFVLSFMEFGRIGNAIMAAALKPFYSMTCGFAVIGMSQHFGGPIKSFLEHNFFAIFSRLSFTLYLFHPLVANFMSNAELFKLNLHLAVSMGFCIIMAHILSLVMTLCVELPFQNLTKSVVIKKKEL